MLQGRRKDRASTQQLSFTVRRQPLFRLLFVCANHSTAISGVNILTDLWIIALPIKTLRGINRPLKEKMALILVFGAGLFATTMSAVRLRSIYTYTLATDPFRDAIPVCLHNPVQTRQTRGSRDTDKAHPPQQVNIWSVIEVNVAILCASVPALKPIFTPHCIRDRRRKNQYRYRGRDESSYGGDSSHIRAR